MRAAISAALGSCTILLSGCASLGSTPTSKMATAFLRSSNGTPAGTVLVAAAGDQMTITVAAAGLAPGVHGLHLHMTGSCDAPTFASAGGHLNPQGMQHGTANPAGSHLGDLPNLTADRYGTGTVTARLSGSRSAMEAALFDADGSALVIHADADDYQTDPSGNSGTRIACGVLKPA